jgi:phosphohistidine phosphatase
VTDVRHLYLLRHAKSSWGDPVADDHERPLAPRGRRAAQLIGDHVHNAKVAPALVLCSSARRTRETLELIAPALGEQAVALVERRLYGASAGELLGRLRDVSDAVGSVMVIGHNPGLEDLAATLAGAGVGDGLERMAMKFPTAALAALTVPTSWRDLAPGGATLAAYVVPRDLG